MKKLLIAGLALLSLNTFAQSYMVLNNGVTLTIDKAGFLYDFNHFFLPYKVQVNGGQFLVSENRLATVDSTGLLFKKDLKVEKIKGKGTNYLVNDDHHIVTVDEKGFYYKFDKDKDTMKKISTFGGNFFVVKTDEKKKIFDLYTLNTKGNYFKLGVQGLNPMDINVTGGNWFSAKGVVHTVSKDGNVFSKADIQVGGIVRRGGNFLIDDSGKIFTVSEEGFLVLPALPMSFNVANIVKVGTNYLIDTEARVYVVTASGSVVERTVADHDVREAKILSF